MGDELLPSEALLDDNVAFLAQADEMKHRLADIDAANVCSHGTFLLFLPPACHNYSWKATDHPIIWIARVRRLGSGAGLCGRFGYSDLKEAALSGAADLWELNRLELLVVASVPEVRVCRGLLSYVLMAADGLRHVA